MPSHLATTHWTCLTVFHLNSRMRRNLVKARALFALLLSNYRLRFEVGRLDLVNFQPQAVNAFFIFARAFLKGKLWASAITSASAFLSMSTFTTDGVRLQFPDPISHVIAFESKSFRIAVSGWLTFLQGVGKGPFSTRRLWIFYSTSL